MSSERGDNQDFHDRFIQAMPPNYKPQPITLVRGEGCTVWDANGKSYLDLMAGIATTSLGHCHPKVVAALEAQSKKIWHVSNLYSTQPQIELAELLIEHSFAEKVFFCNSGGEANEAALKLARRYQFLREPARNEIVAFEKSFHGRTLFTVSVTGQPSYREGFEPVVPGIRHVPYGDLAATESILSDRTAAIIVEPMLGEGGVQPPPAGFLAGLRELANANGCLLVFDEIQTGMGRTGPLFAYQDQGCVPDIMTLAKALGNGIPIGAMLTRREIASALTPGTHGSTFGGNPLAAACASVVIRELTEGGVLAHAQEMGRYLGEALADLANRLGPKRIVAARGAGLLRALELPGPAASAIEGCREAGVLVIPAGANVLRMAPPLIIEKAQLDSGIKVLEEVLSR